MLHDLVNGENELPYYQLRALAEYIDIPTGLLVLFTQCVSIEREEYEKAQGKKAPSDPPPDLRAVCLALLDDVERVVKTAKAHIAASEVRDEIFMKWYDEDENSYLPNMEMLKVWRDAYNAARQK